MRQGAAIPVEIAPAYPEVLKDIEFPDEIELILFISRYRQPLEKVCLGIPELMKLRNELDKKMEEIPNQSSSGDWVRASISDLQSTHSWAKNLLQKIKDIDPLKMLYDSMYVNDDVMGRYSYTVPCDAPCDDLFSSDKDVNFSSDKDVNPARILLYWAVIGLVSELEGYTVEDLTIVVLAHELSHAYTQLGADIDGRRWPVAQFSTTETSVVEGLAQYYTERVLQRLSSRRAGVIQYSGALETYKDLLEAQPAPYKVHKRWIDKKGYTSETIRRALLEIRCHNEKKLVQFEARLAEAYKELQLDN